MQAAPTPSCLEYFSWASHTENDFSFANWTELPIHSSSFLFLEFSFLPKCTASLCSTGGSSNGSPFPCLPLCGIPTPRIQSFLSGSSSGYRSCLACTKELAKVPCVHVLWTALNQRWLKGDGPWGGTTLSCTLWQSSTQPQLPRSTNSSSIYSCLFSFPANIFT